MLGVAPNAKRVRSSLPGGEGTAKWNRAARRTCLLPITPFDRYVSWLSILATADTADGTHDETRAAYA